MLILVTSNHGMDRGSEFECEFRARRIRVRAVASHGRASHRHASRRRASRGRASHGRASPTGGTVDNFTNGVQTLFVTLLTWTLSTSSSIDPINRSQLMLIRSFYLGTPTSLDLQASTTVQGCALFFEGISSDLAFPLHDLDTDVGTCSDGLNATCVNDLMSQANSALDNIMAGTNDTTTSCQSLEARLRDSAPHSCSSAHHGSWGHSNCQRFGHL